MNRGVRLAIAIVLLAATIALLGYTYLAVRERIADLEARNQFLTNQRSDVRIYTDARHAPLYDAILEPGLQRQLQAVVDAEDQAVRAEIMEDVLTELFGRAGPFVVPDQSGFDDNFTWRLRSMVTDETAEQRGFLLQDLTDIATGGAVIPEPVVVEPVTGLLNNFSTLVTALGGLGTGILSFLTFFRGGGVRKLDEEMLALDVELKRIELAKARFEAQDALAASQAS